MSDFHETAYNVIEGENFGTFCSSTRRWITKIKKYQQKHPKQVIIKTENKDGSIVAQIPSSWFKISPKRTMSDKNKESAKNRMTKIQNKA